MCRLRIVVAVVFAACSAQTPPAETGVATADSEAEILQLSDSLDSARQRGDTAIVDRILAEGYFSVDIGGRVTDREHTIAALANTESRNAVAELRMGRDEVRVHVHGDAAVMSSRVRWAEGDGFVANRNTRVFARRGGVWRLAVQHATRIRAEQPVR